MKAINSVLSAAVFFAGFAVLSAQQPAATLKVGEAAPSFAPGEWLKGSPVNSFEKGRWYVLEFWATWCGPCRQAMPELSQLARQYSGKVTFVGVDVWENTHQRDKNADWRPKVRSFVKKLGDGMDYNVAADSTDGRLANSWLVPAGQAGIPASFLIGPDGKIAWIGHPTLLANQLSVRVDGKQALPVLTREERMAPITGYKALIASGDYEKALASVDQWLADPRYDYLSEYNQVRKYTLLTHLDSSEARRQGERLLAEDANAPVSLDIAVNAILTGSDSDLTGPRPQGVDKELAHRMLDAILARSIASDTFSLQEVAADYFLDGDPSMAAKVQKEMLDSILSDKAAFEISDQMLKSIKADLEKYQDASKG